jgi:pimeloyl-ACP methyl ester carboxylesterase
LLLISGELDPLQQPLPAVQTIQIKGAGHYPQLTHSADVSRLITEFSTAITTTENKLSA